MPSATADSLLQGTPVTITAQLNKGTVETAVVVADLTDGVLDQPNPLFSWMLPGDYFDFAYDIGKERLRLRLVGAHTFGSSDVLDISYQLEDGLVYGATALTQAYSAPDSIAGAVNGRLLSFELRALDTISTVDGYVGDGSLIEWTSFVQNASVNHAPQVSCGQATSVDCASAGGTFIPTAAVTDPDPNQTLTLILKSGDTELDRKTVNTPVNNVTVTFNPVGLSLGQHPLSVSVSDGTASAACDTSVTLVDNVPPTFTSVPADLSAVASSSAGASVNYPAAKATDTCSDPVISYSPNSGTLFPVGKTTVVCTATDAAQNQATVSFNVNVVFAWSGVLQPVNADGSSVFKAGSTVPVKFQLTGASAGVTDLAAKLGFAKLSNSVTGTVNEAVSTTAATTGNLFRYDPLAGQYIFNWSTKNLTSGTYQLQIDLGDGGIHTVNLALR